MPEPLTLMFAAAMLDAAVGLVTDQTLGERLRSLRAGKRQRKAFTDALGRAFAEFKEKQPELVASLFDERFVKEVAAPELAKLLTLSLEPDAQRIAVGYASQFGQTVPNVSSAVAELVSCVRRALANEPLLKEVWSQRQVSETHELATTHLPQIQQIRDDVQQLLSDRSRAEEERQIEESVDRILKLRTLPYRLAQRKIAALAQRVLDGELAHLSSRARANVLYWAARIHASDKTTVEAGRHYKEELLTLDPAFDVRVVDAWLSFHGDGVEAGLRHVRDLKTPDGRTACFGLLRDGKGREAALEWLDSQKPVDGDSFTAAGWRSLGITLAEVGKWEQAAESLAAVTPEQIQECPDLAYVEGVLNAAMMLPKGVRHHAFAMNIVDPQIELREGADVAAYRRRAVAKFDEAIQLMNRLGQPERAEAAEFWQDWVMLTDPDQRSAARSRVEHAMAEGQRAVDYVNLAVAFHLEFDAAPLESYLQQRERTVGLSPKDLRAKLTLIRHKQPTKALIGFLEAERKRLSEVLEPAAIAGLMIDALVRDGQAVRAEKVLAENKGHFDPTEFGRFDDLIQLTLGKDVRASLEARYKETNKYEDLKNLVGYLRSRRDWKALHPYLLELFEQERNGQNAVLLAECLRHVQTDTDLLSFLEANSDLEAFHPELCSIRAWTLCRLGRLSEARSLNDKLLQVRANENDIHLHINLALQSGDWEQFPAIVEREWEKRAQLSPKRLLRLASIAAEVGLERALQLIELAVEKAPDDPQVLVDAGALTVALGRDEPAFAWIGKAAQLSAEGGPVQAIHIRDVVDQMPAHAARSRRINDAYSAGEAPIHLVASALSVPLSRILTGSARRNERSTDARHRSVIPIRFGGRVLADLKQMKRPAFDLTSLLLLADVNLLDAVVACFDQVMIPPTVMEALANERRRVRFHQPSLVREARSVARLLQNDALRVWREPTMPPKDLVREVGEDLAELLQAARTRGGRVIRPLPIHKLRTFMEGLADLGTYRNLIGTTRQLASHLDAEGVVDGVALDKADEFLSSADQGAPLGADLVDTDTIYLDDLAVTYLQTAGILEPLARSGRVVFVHPATEARVNELIELEEDQTTVLEVLNNVRVKLRDLLATQKVALLPFARQDDEKDQDEAPSIATEAPTLASLFETLGDCDAVCLDDRFVGKHPQVTDRSGRSVPLFGIYDLIHLLEARNQLSKEDRLGIVHTLRKRGFALIPVELEELEARLGEAQLEPTRIHIRETAELRILRQSMARLRSLDVLRQPAETAYLDRTRLACVLAIRRIWRDDTNSDALARAKSDWLYRHVMPAPLDWAHTIVHADQVMPPEEAMALQISLLLSPIGGDRERTYAEWIEESVIAPLLPAYSNVVRAAAQRAAENIVAWAEEMDA